MDCSEQVAGKKSAKKDKPKSQATILLLLTKDCEKWHSPDGAAYISVPVNGHVEHLPVKGTAFRRWLQREFFANNAAVPNAQAVNDALGVIEGCALFDGPEHSVNLRVAEHDGDIYVDLCDSEWKCVQVTPRGWRVVRSPPVRFRRVKAMLPLPGPQRGGTVAELRQQLAVAAADWPLLIAWLLAALRPCGPYPVLNLYAEQGAGKTTLARKLRLLVDPNSAPVRCEPKEPRDLMICGNNGWLLALDNLSYLTPWLSDALCRLSTGGGFSTRTLYENDEETIFDSTRPTILTGIEEVVTRGDLLDRSIIVSLPAIPEHERRPESEIWRAFEAARPRLLGVLYDAVAAALKNLSRTVIAALPRMADFALWATAAEPAIGLQPGEFMQVYAGNRAGANELAIDASAAGKAVLDFLASTSLWTGSATDLLSELEAVADEKTRRLKGWPQSARTLSGQLKRLAPNLRGVGIEVGFGTAGRGQDKRRSITIAKVAESSVPTVPSVPGSHNQGAYGDDGDATGGDGDAAGTQGDIDASPYGARAGTHGDGGDDEIPAYSAESIDVPSEAF